MIKVENHVFVIFGATGDLFKRKLLPALFDLYIRGILPKSYLIIGCGRKNITNKSFIKKSIINNKNLINIKYIGKKAKINEFKKQLVYNKINPDNKNDFIFLKENLYSYFKKNNINKRNVLFYFSTPPSAFQNIIKNLLLINLNNESDGWKRLILEKPFGTDLKSCKNLNLLLKKKFKEKQLYRIDHYLGKETVQNLLVSRFSNLVFNALWNRNFISYIEITAAERIGIEKRGGYYDNAGAIKDMFQNHLLELLCLTAMEEPKDNSSESIRDEKIKVLRKIKNINYKDHVVRGQYTRSKNSKRFFKGYRDNEGVDKKSKTETFFACKLFVENERWKDVPFFIRTGKRLPTKVTEIVVNFKKNINVFNEKNQSNVLIFRIQPDEGLIVKFNLKKPGNKSELLKKNLEFHYKELGENVISNAYETLILDVLKGNTMLFSRSDFVEKAWKIVDPIVKSIKKENIKLYAYKAGSWGPKKADEIFRNENTWRYPCKNLVNDGEICEL